MALKVKNLKTTFFLTNNTCRYYYFGFGTVSWLLFKGFHVIWTLYIRSTEPTQSWFLNSLKDKVYFSSMLLEAKNYIFCSLWQFLLLVCHKWNNILIHKMCLHNITQSPIPNACCTIKKKSLYKICVSIKFSAFFFCSKMS